MIVFFGNGLKLFNPYGTIKIICQQFNVQKYPKIYITSYLDKISSSSNSVRYLQTNEHKLTRKTPDLIYVPQVLRWIKTKIKLKYLQKRWDPDFSEGAFIFGSSQAVCKVTEIIHDHEPQNLKNLLTESARIKLIVDINTKLTPLQTKIIKITPPDIKIMLPTEIRLKTKDDAKICTVSLRTLALKWYDDDGKIKLVLVALQTDFIRDYGDGVNPEWTISVFDILECALVNYTSAT